MGTTLVLSVECRFLLVEFESGGCLLLFFFFLAVTRFAPAGFSEGGQGAVSYNISAS